MTRCLLLLCLMSLVLLSSCAEYTPKPHGQLRLEFPKQAYVSIDSLAFPFTFLLPQSATLTRTDAAATEGLNLLYPDLQLSISFSYLYATNKAALDTLYAFSQKLVSEASVFAEKIDESIYENTEKSVYGQLFQMHGKSVSPIQFMLTDSVHHFFRGALYFHQEVDADSVMPVVDYVSKDVKVLIESFNWK